MGITNNKQPSLNHNNWIQVKEPKHCLFPNINGFRAKLLFNIITHQYIEQYNRQFNTPEECQQAESEFQWRKQTNSPPPLIYPIKYIENTTKSQLCSSLHSVAVYFEKVEVRLKEVNDIPYYDALYVLKSCLMGFESLFRRYGTFQIQEEMVFIDKKGKVRLWICGNLSSWFVEKSSSSECEMVESIIAMVQSNTDKDEVGYPPFSYHLKKKQLIGRCLFEEAIKEFNLFCQSLKIKVPFCMKSVADLYDEEPQPSNEHKLQSYQHSESSNTSLIKPRNQSQPHSRFHEGHQMKQNNSFIHLLSNSNSKAPKHHTKSLTPNTKPNPHVLSQYYNHSNRKSSAYQVVYPPPKSPSIFLLPSPQSKTQVKFMSPADSSNSTVKMEQNPKLQEEGQKDLHLKKKCMQNKLSSINIKYQKKTDWPVKVRSNFDRKYYSSSNTHELDAQIAADIEKLLNKNIL